MGGWAEGGALKAKDVLARGEKKEIKRLLWRCVCAFFSRQFTVRGISFIELVL